MSPRSPLAYLKSIDRPIILCDLAEPQHLPISIKACLCRFPIQIIPLASPNHQIFPYDVVLQ